MAIYSWILEHSDIIGLIIDFIALVVSVILTVVISLAAAVLFPVKENEC